MTRSILKISLLFAVILTAATAFAQGTISGTVKNNKGAALSRAVVSVVGTNIGAIADEQGAYEISDVPNGKYLVEASSNGYESDNDDVVVSNNNVTANFVLGKVSKGIREVVVTGVNNPKSALESSISISTLKSKDINNAVARTTGEIFRTIPGIRSESSGGEGNSNITVRGVPVSAGGSRYMLIQEDGLPVLQFGDMAFATQDQFLRYDNTVNRIEAVRGGSASVLASNSPAGIINFISKNGESEGGSIATTIGLDMQMLRTDFEYGAPLSKDLSFHVGGFYRTGDGPRGTGYTSNNGGQIKANLTKKFNGGYTRFYVKMLNDRAAAYMPMPVQVSGTNAAPVWESLAAYDALRGALQSPYLLQDRTMGVGGLALQSDISDGMHSKTNAIGNELSVNVGEGWKLTNRMRMSFNNGQFLAPFPANVGSAASIVGGIPGYGSATYAGTSTPIDAAANFMRIHLFNTTLNNFNNYSNDFSVSKKLNNVKVNAGLYKAIQKVSMAWHWNTYLMEVNSGSGRLVDVKDTAGKDMTSNGLLAYGVPAWGNCCSRTYNTTYDITAPYASVEIAASNALSLDAGLRYDMGHVFGSFAGANGQTATIDMNGNGTIESNETNVATISSVSTPVNYKYNYASYSIGANYLVNRNQSVFARVSKGGSASADRVLFSGYNYTNGTDSGLNAQKVNYVTQAEAGYKYRKNKLVLNATGFYALTKESNYEATTQKKFDNTYRSAGLELDAVAAITNNFGLRGGLTFTKAKIVDAKDTSVIGNTPRRLPTLMFNITPTYTFDAGHSIGLTMLAMSKSFAQDNNDLIMPGYLIVNPYVNFNIIKKLNFNLSANNILNSLGITESEEGSITNGTNNIVRARPVPGRSITASVRYNF
jgi:outer membrane receptor protein involved in Fe transport